MRHSLQHAKISFSIFLCVVFAAVVAAQQTRSLCKIPDQASATFRFASEQDCNTQRKAISASVTPDLPFSETAQSSTACVVQDGLYIFRGPWVQYPRGLDLSQFRLEETFSPRTYHFYGRQESCTGCRSFLEKTACTTPLSVTLGVLIVFAWVLFAFNFLYS
jgi:hypothetical protein